MKDIESDHVVDIWHLGQVKSRVREGKGKVSRLHWNQGVSISDMIVRHSYAVKRERETKKRETCKETGSQKDKVNVLSVY